MLDVTLTVLGPPSPDLSVETSDDTYPLELTDPYTGGTSPPYIGPYEVVPTQNEQNLQTANKSMSRNVVIAPIPSNYGLITWDGSKLRVS